MEIESSFYLPCHVKCFWLLSCKKKFLFLLKNNLCFFQQSQKFSTFLKICLKFNHNRHTEAKNICCFLATQGWRLSEVEMGPDPTPAYFWATVNKRLTRLRPGYFPTRPEEKKIQKFDVFGENFQIQTQTINGWPDPTRFLAWCHDHLSTATPGPDLWASQLLF